MTFINSGALVNGAPPRTKKALRDALSSAPDTVEFYGTSMLGPQLGGRIGALSIPDDVTLTVVGPDPANDRKWYASVTRTDDRVVAK